jgi:hypothetical protein
MLAISLELATLTKLRSMVDRGRDLFRASLIELGRLGLLVLALVFSITQLVPNRSERRWGLNPLLTARSADSVKGE